MNPNEINMEPSDYRSPLNPQNTQTSNNTESLKTKNDQVIKTNKNSRINAFPGKEQAIILNAVEGLTLTDYVVAAGKIVEPKNILFASKISNNRICVYLSNTEFVDIICNHTSINIDGKEIGIRRLITPARRIILSNVCPSIPHDVLLHTITRMGVVPVSPMSFLRAGITGDEYGHVLSFRRQIYIQPNVEIELPSSVVITYENTNYRIFLTFDDLKCFICKTSGHIASQCPNQNNASPATNDAIINQPSENTTIAIVYTPNESNVQNYTKTPGLKRNASSIASSSLEQGEIEEEEEDAEHKKPTVEASSNTPIFQIPQQKTHKTVKKPKHNASTESLTPIEELMKPAQIPIESKTPPFILNFQQISSFLDNVTGSVDPLSIARQYTNNIPQLLEMMHSIYPHFKHRSIKSRCTRIQKKIKKQLDMEQSTGEDTDASGSSQMSTY